MRPGVTIDCISVRSPYHAEVRWLPAPRTRDEDNPLVGHIGIECLFFSDANHRLSPCFRMIIGSVLFLAICTGSSYAIEESVADAAKRAPMGFQGMRGKKDLIPSSSERDDEISSKRTLMDLQVRSGDQSRSAHGECYDIIHSVLHADSPRIFEAYEEHMKM